MADKNDIPQFVNSDSFMADKNYVKWLSDLKKRFHIAQLRKCSNSIGVWARTFVRSRSNISGAQTS